MNNKLKIIDNKKPTGTDVYHHFTEIKNENWKKWEKSFSKEYKEYRWKWENYPKNLTIPEAPLNIETETSNRCWLLCPMCPRTAPVISGTWREQKDMEFDLFKDIVDQSVEMGVYALNLNFLGEPLLNRKLPEMIKYAKEKGILDVFLHTSGGPMGDKKLEMIMTSGLDKLSISFDSPYKEKYEKIRVNASYDKILENIKKISDFKKKTGQVKPLTRINFIKFRETKQQEINDLIKLFSSLVDSIGILDYVDPHKTETANLKEGYISKWVCPQILTRLNIWVDGSVHVCCQDYNNELNIGNVKKQNIKDIWKSDKLKKIREKHFEGKWYEVPGCKNCTYAIQGDLKSQVETSMFENMI